ncbi:MAG: HNH endonuclease [Thermoplasmata archaeon]|nr:HNH endonuclease [Thermoplasmata archaeon]
MVQDNRGVYTEDELTLVLGLYKTLDKRDIDEENPRIKALSEFMEVSGTGPQGRGRSPTSIKAKMGNFLAIDPDYGGMGRSHGGKLDAVVWNRYQGNGFANLADAVLEIESRLTEGYSTGVHLFEGDVTSECEVGGRTRAYMVKARINQGIFRNRILGSYDETCCISGLKEPMMLVASHIKPWAACDEGSAERLDPCNGLCLNSFLDRAFDRGLFTVGKDNEVKVSPALLAEEARKETAMTELLCRYDGTTIKEPRASQYDPNPVYLKFHRDNIFADTPEKLRAARGGRGPGSAVS